VNTHYQKKKICGKKASIQKQSGFTFQRVGHIAEPNRLGAKINEMLHQRLLKNRVGKQLRKRQIWVKSTETGTKRKRDKQHSIAN
jgi:hypothetical protein